MNVLSALAPTGFTWPTAPYPKTIDKAGEACRDNLERVIVKSFISLNHCLGPFLIN
jgi:hypothetical protein